MAVAADPAAVNRKGEEASELDEDAARYNTTSQHSLDIHYNV